MAHPAHTICRTTTRVKRREVPAHYAFRHLTLVCQPRLQRLSPVPGTYEEIGRYNHLAVAGFRTWSRHTRSAALEYEGPRQELLTMGRPPHSILLGLVSPSPPVGPQ
ncbi:hypothetical protein KI387_019226, partial [Taxus chinensis]